MSTGRVETFERSLETVEARSTVTTPADFEDVLSEVIEEPAVGAPLPFDEVSLDGTSVNCDPTEAVLKEAATGVTGARLGIASLGTITVESRREGDELVSLLPKKHVVVIRATDITDDLRSFFRWVSTEFDRGRRSLVLVTGPSATGDMGALVRGVHGPDTEHVVIVDDVE